MANSKSEPSATVRRWLRVKSIAAYVFLLAIFGAAYPVAAGMISTYNKIAYANETVSQEDIAGTVADSLENTLRLLPFMVIAAIVWMLARSRLKRVLKPKMFSGQSTPPRNAV